nr:MAG TPA_asm: putative CHROMOSOME PARTITIONING PROTEIN PARB [Caudoviricetes sp.]
MVVAGNHPYADEFPMASAEELDELAASIATVGLIHPIVLTPQGLVLDGRNRLAACEKAGVEPTFETRDGDDDDYKEFVIGANTTGRRESMTVQIAAASVALVLGHDKRKNGRWVRNTHTSETGSMEATVAKNLSYAGLVLDELGPAHLREVRDGDASLNAKYEQARRHKDEREQAEARKVEAERQAEQREQRAREFFDGDSDAQAWLDAKPAGTFTNMRAAFAAIQEEREEIRQAEQARREAEEAEQREHQELIERHARYLDAFVSNFQTGLDMAGYLAPLRDEILNATTPTTRDRFLEIESTYLKGH